MQIGRMQTERNSIESASRTTNRRFIIRRALLTKDLRITLSQTLAVFINEKATLYWDLYSDRYVLWRLHAENTYLYAVSFLAQPSFSLPIICFSLGTPWTLTPRRIWRRRLIYMRFVYRWSNMHIIITSVILHGTASDDKITQNTTTDRNE